MPPEVSAVVEAHYLHGRTNPGFLVVAFTPTRKILKVGFLPDQNAGFTIAQIQSVMDDQAACQDSDIYCPLPYSGKYLTKFRHIFSGEILLLDQISGTPNLDHFPSV